MSDGSTRTAITSEDPPSARLFQTAPEEVTRYFRAKTDRPAFDWRDVAPEEHAYAFTVAKATSQEILSDIRAAVDDAIVNRVPFAEFKARLQPLLEEKGWWGRKLVRDPKDGTDKLAQLGSPRRLRTIYWANVRSAHAAGEWQRTQRTKAFLPFLVYTLSVSEHRRPEHQGWVGTVLPVDDPWWSSHYPPNGWGCKCGVRQITRREAANRGYDPDEGAPPVELRPWRNKRTGETLQVPKGIDPGWHINPGRTRGAMLSELMSGRLLELPPSARPAAVADLVASPAFDRFVDDAVAVGRKRAELVKEFEREGRSISDEELDRRHPFGLTSFPVAIAPARFGDDYLPVLIDASTTQNAATRLGVPSRNLIENLGQILSSGTAMIHGEAFLVSDPTIGLVAQIKRGPGAWRAISVSEKTR